MKRFLLVSVFVVLPTAWGLADAPGGVSIFDQGKYLERNAPLIEKLVDDGLHLAEQKNALDRAKACGSIAAELADEINKAARNKEAARATELSLHLQIVLQRGVAANLRTARRDIYPGSSEDAKLFKSTKDAADLIHRLEAQLKDGFPEGKDPLSDRSLLPAKRGCDAVTKAVRDIDPQ